MSSEDIRQEINKELDRLPQPALEEVLLLLQKVRASQHVNLLDQKELSKMLSEDSELLQRLAQ